MGNSGCQSGSGADSPRKYLAKSGEFSVFLTGGRGGCWHAWMEARDAANPPTVHRRVPTTWKPLAPNVNNAEVGKPLVKAPALGERDPALAKRWGIKRGE